MSTVSPRYIGPRNGATPRESEFLSQLGPTCILGIKGRAGRNGHHFCRVVDAGADVNSCDTEGCTPLHVAVNYRDSEGADLVAALVSKGAAIDREADGGMSGLIMERR